MAELLVLLRGKVCPGDPAKDRRILKRGHVVCVYKDGACRELLKDELGPIFALIKIPGVDPVRFQKYLSPFTNVDGSPYKAREWIFDIDALCEAGKIDLDTKEMRIEIKASGAAAGDLAWDTAKACISNARTNNTEASL